MPIHFSVRESRPEKVSGSLISNLANVGISSLVLQEEGRLTQNLESAALAGNHLSSSIVYAAHWAGGVDPVTAANQLAFLDNRLSGRFGLRITESPDANVLGHEAVWRRTNEYLTLLKRLWSNEKPVDQECEFYSVQQGFVASKGPQGAHLPILMTGLTGTALQVCARHATIFEIAFCPHGEATALIQKVRDAAARFGRPKAISFALAVPDAAIARALLSSRTNQLETVADILRPYLEIGITEFIFDASAAAGPLLARITELKSVLENQQSEPAAARHPVHFARLSRSMN